MQGNKRVRQLQLCTQYSIMRSSYSVLCSEKGTEEMLRLLLFCLLIRKSSTIACKRRDTHFCPRRLNRVNQALIFARRFQPYKPIFTTKKKGRRLAGWPTILAVFFVAARTDVSDLFRTTVATKTHSFAVNCMTDCKTYISWSKFVLSPTRDRRNRS